MKKYYILFVSVLFVIVVIVIVGYFFKKVAEAPIIPNQNQVITAPVNIVADSNIIIEDNQFPKNELDSLGEPLDRSRERVTKKPFGIFITPQNSPVSSENFRGYHTGTDFEIFSEELNSDISVRAICEGKIILKKYATGYGGVLVKNCEINSESVTVIYGHLNLNSIVKSVGDNLEAGEVFGKLGADKSNETSGERKHLHLGIHKGSVINILGYVQSKKELDNWIDPCLYVCK